MRSELPWQWTKQLLQGQGSGRSDGHDACLTEYPLPHPGGAEARGVALSRGPGFCRASGANIEMESQRLPTPCQRTPMNRGWEMNVKPLTVCAHRGGHEFMNEVRSGKSFGKACGRHNWREITPHSRLPPPPCPLQMPCIPHLPSCHANGQGIAWLPVEGEGGGALFGLQMGAREATHAAVQVRGARLSPACGGPSSDWHPSIGEWGGQQAHASHAAHRFSRRPALPRICCSLTGLKSCRGRGLKSAPIGGSTRVWQWQRGPEAWARLSLPGERSG